jgi:hypothetical protein
MQALMISSNPDRLIALTDFFHWSMDRHLIKQIAWKKLSA